jgi:hypothetical protein
MKTRIQIADEILRLKDLKKLIPASSAFGDDNAGAIKAEIEVLENNYSSDEIEDYFEDDSYVMDSAMGAYDWMNDEVDESPSSNWEPLVRRLE